MAFELKPNSGSVFKNQRRRNDNDAAYTGTALVDGKEYWLNCWPKKDKNGDTWMSFSFREKQPRTEKFVIQHLAEISEEVEQKIAQMNPVPQKTEDIPF